MLFGGAGAVVGASTRKQHAECTGLYIKLTVNDSAQPSVLLHILGNAKTDGLIYKSAKETAQNILSKLELITKNQSSDNLPKESQSLTIADQLRDLKSLLDDQIITEDEFNQKKKELLGL